jgi:fumarate hydratase, class II
MVGSQRAAPSCGAKGNFDLSVMTQALFTTLLESVKFPAVVTGLNRRIGYNKASEIAKLSVEISTLVRKLCRERLTELGFPEVELTGAPDPAHMCAPI